MRSRLPQDASLREITAQVHEMLKDAIAKSRSLSHELSPGVLHGDDLAEILRWLATGMQAKHGLTVHVHGQARAPSGPIKVLLYRTAQELLFNAVKHAQVGSVAVQLHPIDGQEFRITVSDAGRGFDPAKVMKAVERGSARGLLSIHERLELIGGSMESDSSPGKGSRFTITVPIDKAAEVE